MTGDESLTLPFRASRRSGFEMPRVLIMIMGFDVVARTQLILARRAIPPLLRCIWPWVDSLIHTRIAALDLTESCWRVGVTRLHLEELITGNDANCIA